MIIKRSIRWVIILMLLSSFMTAGLWSPTAQAEQSRHFKLEMEERESGASRELVVSITGYNLVDVYAYELHFQFDPRRLELKGAASDIHGFTLSPQVEEDTIKVGHTKIGPVNGDDGDIVLVKLTFHVLAQGESELVLKEVRLVDSDLNMIIDEVDVRLQAGPFILIELIDIKGHWAEKDIRRAAELGWVVGYEDGTFLPDRRITRAEFAVMMVNAKGIALPSTTVSLPFADADSIPQWAQRYIAAAVDAGWLSGYEDGTFRANEWLTRAELAVIVTQAAELNIAAEAAATFTDADQIPSWAHPYVAAGVQKGLIAGKENNRFAAKDHTTRAEAVSILLR